MERKRSFPMAPRDARNRDGHLTSCTTHLLEKRVMLTHIAVRKHQNRKHQVIDVDMLLKISAKKNNKIKTINESVRINPRKSSNLPREFGIYRRRPTRTAGSIAATLIRCCIVDRNLSVLALNILREVEKDIPGLTDTTMPRRLGPKRANNIRKEEAVLCGRAPASGEERQEDEVQKHKIHRLITPVVLERKGSRLAIKNVALSRVRVYGGAGPAPSEHICRRTGPLITESRSSVGDRTTKKRDETNTAKKSETGKKAVTGDKKEKKIAKKDGVVGAKKRRNRSSKEVRFGLAVFVI
ncbi:40S ribosomal protein S6 [Culex quinquefasciatus]|uniref:Small ribosomal subunit protein eS6 n=2 Tax=Culex quinquefasciatus TaxID=7176 RepID=B0WHX5_CULQU|nr:40S ribosomal protein S6 [Culex quinquefasciatus]|eukprot:XP_001848309.1 40S ribosomal protein S6 [Culex quinquefasciatus]